MRLAAKLPSAVAAVRLRLAVQEPLSLRGSRDVSDAQLEYLASVAADAKVRLPQVKSADEFEAWLYSCWATMRKKSLVALKLRKGDIVFVGGDRTDVAAVSSISSTGVVYFTGGGRDWPDRLAVGARSADKSAKAGALRLRTVERAAHRAPQREWSVAKHESLKAFVVEKGPSSSVLEELERVVKAAENEKPLQKFLEVHPEILASLLPGQFRYVLPQVRIGKDYVADFFLASVDSRGVSWTLVELETPRSTTALKTKNDFEEHARTGIAQVEEWREWLQDNLDQSRRTDHNGLGLTDIRPGVDGLVVVGTRERLAPRANPLRDRLSESKRIHVHTYDWLLDTVREAIDFSGPPAYNPYLLSSSRPD